MSAHTSRCFFSFLSDITVGEGNVAATLPWIRVLRLRKAQPGSSKPVSDGPGGGFFPSKEGERKRHTKAVRFVPYQRLRERVEKREIETDQAPWIPPERLLNCVSTTSRRAPRLMEPARGLGPITAAFPPAAGQWRSAFLVRGRSRLLSLAVVCGLGLVRAPIWSALGLQLCSGAFVSSFCVLFRVRVFLFFFCFFFCSAR